MDEALKSYIKLNIFLGYSVYIDEEIGELYCPKIKEINIGLIYYIYMFNKFIDLYDEDKDSFFNNITKTEDIIREFMTFVSFFKKTENIYFKFNTFYFDKNCINNKNINLFMDTIKIMHHMDKKIDDYKPANKVAEEMLKRARKLRKEMQQKIKKKDGIGFLEIMSSVCARHPSINQLNIHDLSYFQIIEQYMRLQKIDDYEVNMNALVSGTLGEEGRKKIKHYSSKIENE